MLALYHLYFGKVDPEKLSSQWNFSARPLDVEAGLERFRQALAAGEIQRELRAREAAASLVPAWPGAAEGIPRRSQAAGGWSPISGWPDDEAGHERSARARTAVSARR